MAFSVVFITISVLLIIISPRPTTADSNACIQGCSDAEKLCRRDGCNQRDQVCINLCHKGGKACKSKCQGAVTGRLFHRRDEDLLPELLTENRFY